MGFLVRDRGNSKMEQLVCPKCGEPMGNMAGIRGILHSCPNRELQGQCSCGEKYVLRLSLYGVVISFPDRQVSLAC